MVGLGTAAVFQVLKPADTRLGSGPIDVSVAI